MSSAVITEIQPEHIAKMVDIFVEGQKFHSDTFPDVFIDADDRPAIAAYINSFGKPRTPFRTRRNFALVWLKDAHVAGYLLYNLYKTSDIFFGSERWTCFIDDIAIAQDNRSEGGASLLFEKLLETVKDKQNCVMSGQVWRGNNGSEALFEKHGFEAKSKHFYRIVD